MVVGPFQWSAPQSGTLSRILSGTRPSVQSVSDVCLRRTCLLDTSALSTLEVLCRLLLRYINLLTYLLTYLLSYHTNEVISIQNLSAPPIPKGTADLRGGWRTPSMFGMDVLT